MTEDWEQKFGEVGIIRSISLEDANSPIRPTSVPPENDGARRARERYVSNSRVGPSTPTPGSRGPKPKQGRRPGNIDQDVTTGIPSRASMGQEANEETRLPPTLLNGNSVPPRKPNPVEPRKPNKKK